MNGNSMSNNDRKNQLIGIILMLVAATLFGTLGTLTNVANEAGISPVAFATWREFLGAVSMIVLLLLGVGRPRQSEKTSFKSIPKKQFKFIFFAGIAFSAYSLAIFYAFVELTVALAMILFYIFPAIVTIICAVAGLERLNLPKLIALILSLSGGLLAVLGQIYGETVKISTLGVFLALGAAVGMSVFYLIGRGGYKNIPESYATTFFLMMGTILFLIIGIGIGELDAILQPFREPSLLLILLFAGVIAAAVPTMLMLMSIRKIGASRASTLQIFEPVVAAVLAAIFLGQQIHFVSIIGGALIILAAFILQRKTDANTETPDTANLVSENVSKAN